MSIEEDVVTAVENLDIYIYKEWPEYPTTTNLYVAPHVLKINCTSAIRTIVLHLKYSEVYYLRIVDL